MTLQFLQIVKLNCKKPLIIWKAIAQPKISALVVPKKKKNCGKKPRFNYPFKLNGKYLDHVTCFKYPGITFNYNGKCNVGVKEVKEQGRRAMLSLLQKSRLLHLPISVQIELFKSFVQPILTYACEVWVALTLK